MNEQTRPVNAVWWFPLRSWKLHEEKEKELTVAWMRGEAWIAHCLKVAGLKATSRLSEVVFSEVQISDDSLRAYKTARDIPPVMAIRQVNKVLPGTLETWNTGPDGLPLWSVLEQDRAACLALVDGELANHADRPKWSFLSDGDKRILDMSLVHKAQALLEVTVPEHFWSRRYWSSSTDSGAVDAELDPQEPVLSFGRFMHKDRDTGHLTLDEFIGRPHNVLATAYIDGSKRAKTARGRFSFAEYKYITSHRRLLSLLALCVLLNSDSDAFGKEVAYYIRLGIDQALHECFGSAMHEYVVKHFVE